MDVCTYCRAGFADFSSLLVSEEASETVEANCLALVALVLPSLARHALRSRWFRSYSADSAGYAGGGPLTGVEPLPAHVTGRLARQTLGFSGRTRLAYGSSANFLERSGRAVGAHVSSSFRELA